MAAPTLVETFKVLRDTDEWLSSIEIAFKAKKGERACRQACKKLMEDNLVRVRLVNKRQYFLMSPLSTKQKKLAVVVDINETIKIKDKK